MLKIRSTFVPDVRQGNEVKFLNCTRSCNVLKLACSNPLSPLEMGRDGQNVLSQKTY